MTLTTPRTATLHRMVMAKHMCPYGLKSLDLLRRQGFRVEDHHLTTRAEHPLKPTQAQTAVAAALLRQLHAVVTTGAVWDAAIATHGSRRTPVEARIAA